MHPITLVIPNIECGGAERVITHLANWLILHGHNVQLITFDKKDKELPLHQNVQRFFITSHKKDFVQDSNYMEEANVKALQHILVKIQARNIISFLPRMNVRVLKAAPTQAKVIISERTYPPLRADFTLELKNLCQKYYAKAHAMVVLTQRCADDWAYTLVEHNKVHIIPNPIMPHQGPKYTLPNDFTQKNLQKQPYILFVGRLNADKGCLDLLEAFAVLHGKYSELRLVIVGNGPLKQQLIETSKALHIDEQVLFVGQCDNPTQLYLNAHFFVLPSNFEGYPNTLHEAMFYGCACIAADCPTGPREMLGNNERGLLFTPNDITMLVKHMEYLHINKSKREQYAQLAQSFVSNHSDEKIFPLWLRLFEV